MTVYYCMATGGRIILEPRDKIGHYYWKDGSKVYVDSQKVFFTDSVAKVLLFDELDKCSTHEEAVALIVQLSKLG